MFQNLHLAFGLLIYIFASFRIKSRIWPSIHHGGATRPPDRRRSHLNGAPDARRVHRPPCKTKLAGSESANLPAARHHHTRQHPRTRAPPRPYRPLPRARPPVPRPPVARNAQAAHIGTVPSNEVRRGANTNVARTTTRTTTAARRREERGATAATTAATTWDDSMGRQHGAVVAQWWRSGRAQGARTTRQRPSGDTR